MLFWSKKPLIYQTANGTCSLLQFFGQFLNFIFSPCVFTSLRIYTTEGIKNNSNNKAGAAAEMAATRKEEKYVDLGACCIFEPIAVETLGVFNASARHLLDDLGRRISENTGEARETSFLYQRISILVQRFNAVLLHDSLPATVCTDWWSYPILYSLFHF